MGSSETTGTLPMMESTPLDLHRIPSMDFDGEDDFNFDDNGLCLRSWGEKSAGLRPPWSWKMVCPAILLRLWTDAFKRIHTLRSLSFEKDPKDEGFF